MDKPLIAILSPLDVVKNQLWPLRMAKNLAKASEKSNNYNPYCPHEFNGTVLLLLDFFFAKKNFMFRKKGNLSKTISENVIFLNEKLNFLKNLWSKTF